MTSKIFDYFKDILAGNLRFSQLFVLLCTIVATGWTYIIQREKSWFQELLADFGSLGPFFLSTVCFAFFLVIFQMISRTCAYMMLRIRQHIDRINAPKRILEHESEQIREIRETFNKLSDWQKDFLVMAVQSNQRQWRRYQMPSGYEIIWGPEVKVLLQKKIVRQIDYDVFLIDDVFFETLQNAYLAQLETTNANKSD